MNYILEVENLTKKYKKSSFSLNNVSFGVPYGSIVGFIGENGAGKTTTIGCILNVLNKNNGRVSLFDKEMQDCDTSIREDIGVVFDAANFSEHLYVEQLSKVMDGIYLNWDQKYFLKCLEQFQIPMKKKIRTLSKGMSMKLSVAVALSHHPKLLILDEATSGLDPVVRDELLDVFLDFVQDEKHSIFISSHITSDLEKIADYIIFIHNGEIILEAKKDDLIYNYGIIRCGQSQFEEIDKTDIIAFRNRDYQKDVLIKNRDNVEKKHNNLIIDNVLIDELMLLLIKGEKI